MVYILVLLKENNFSKFIFYLLSSDIKMEEKSVQM
jgi:hypothetical protein